MYTVVDMYKKVAAFMGSGALVEDTTTCMTYHVTKSPGHRDRSVEQGGWMKPNTILTGILDDSPLFVIAIPHNKPGVVAFCAGDNVDWVQFDETTKTLGPSWQPPEWDRLLRIAGYISIWGTSPKKPLTNLSALESPSLWALGAASEKDRAMQALMHLSKKGIPNKSKERNEAMARQYWLPSAEQNAADGWVDFVLKYGRPPYAKEEFQRGTPDEIYLPRFDVKIPIGVPVVTPSGVIECNDRWDLKAPHEIAFKAAGHKNWYTTPIRVLPAYEHGQMVDSSPFKHSYVKGVSEFIKKLEGAASMPLSPYMNEIATSNVYAYERMSGYVLNAKQMITLQKLIGALNCDRIATYDSLDPVNRTLKMGEWHNPIYCPLDISPDDLTRLIAVYGKIDKEMAISFNKNVGRERSSMESR